MIEPMTTEAIRARMEELRIDYPDHDAALLRCVELEHKLKQCRADLYGQKRAVTTGETEWTLR